MVNGLRRMEEEVKELHDFMQLDDKITETDLKNEED